jgi:hypothetical protein
VTGKKEALQLSAAYPPGLGRAWLFALNLAYLRIPSKGAHACRTADALYSEHVLPLVKAAHNVQAGIIEGKSEC